MEQDNKKKVIMPIFTSLAMIALSTSALIKGIDKHETWRIVLASASGLIFIGMTGLTLFTTFRTKKISQMADGNE